MNNEASVQCWIYRSPRQIEMYLYLAKPDAFDEMLPAPLLKRFGTPALVMELDLHPGRQLAWEDINQVLENLRTHGYHLQLPPNINPMLYQGE